MLSYDVLKFEIVKLVSFLVFFFISIQIKEIIDNIVRLASGNVVRNLGREVIPNNNYIPTSHLILRLTYICAIIYDTNLSNMDSWP